MTRQMNFTNSNELLTTPPPIVDADVSARWKRTWKREVVMTVILPDDVVDTELYVKTTRGHIGIQMDPWMSCSWKRNWSTFHSPTPRPRRRSENTGSREQAGGSVFSGLQAETATGLPDQTPGVIMAAISITEGHHLQPGQLPEDRIPLHLPNPSGES